MKIQSHLGFVTALASMGTGDLITIEDVHLYCGTVCYYGDLNLNNNGFRILFYVLKDKRAFRHREEVRVLIAGRAWAVQCDAVVDLHSYGILFVVPLEYDLSGCPVAVPWDPLDLEGS